MTLVQQIEAAFGTIQHGWTRGVDGRDLAFQVIECRNGQGRTVFSTLGLSNTPLWSSELGRPIRLELVIPALEHHAALWMTKALTDLGILFLDQARPPLQGSFFDFGPGLVAETDYTGVYFTVAFFLPEEHRVLDREGEAVVVVWCIPITAEEAEVLASAGWPALEERFAADPNILVEFRH